MKFKIIALLAALSFGFSTLIVPRANSLNTLHIADSQNVIVKIKNAQNNTGLDRIGKSQFYKTTMSIARGLKESGKADSISLPQNYKLQLVANDPLEPQGYLTLLDAENFWDESTGDSSITVAVIDSGFALAHEDLAGKWYQNPGESGALASNGIDDDSNGYIDDWQGWDFAYNDNDPSAGSVDPNGSAVGHGTAVSGLVGAIGNNSIGVASLNWNVKIMPLQIFQDDGTATTTELASAMDYAINNGADVINLSLGSTGTDSVIEGLLADAEAAGIVVVAAAGNCGDTDYALQGCSYQGQTIFPATDSRTIAVGATTLSDTRASFSSYSGSIVDVSAPGSGSISTTLYDSADPNGAYSATIYGTSFSTPITSSLVATLKGAWPAASPHDIRALLVDTALKTSAMGSSVYTNYLGFGRIRPLNAIQRIATCSTVTYAEDINCDNSINIVDISILVSQWQMNRTGRTDINASGKTDLVDISLLVSKWGL